MFEIRKIFEEPEYYKDMLSMPLEILKDAGVDMMSIEPYKLIEKMFVEKLHQLKELL